MKTVRLQSTADPLYESFRIIYDVSFPIYEQRTVAQQEYAFSFSCYYLEAYIVDEALIGFIAYWEFTSYLYVEHFAIHPDQRGKGTGKKILEHLIQIHPKYILLEIDPVQDEISARRLHFYRSLGFIENSYQHIHPAYRKGYEGHNLVVLTTERMISPEEYTTFAYDLSHMVMNE